MDSNIEDLTKKLDNLVQMSAGKDNSEQNDVSVSNKSIDISSISHSSFPGAVGLSPPQGHCVKEYQEKMAALKTENFNLKLKIYYLEENLSQKHSPTNGEENYFKQNIDLKVELESVRHDLQDKQELLCQAAKAMELLEQQQGEQHEKYEIIIDELNTKIEVLTLQVRDLQKAKADKSIAGNDTGFAEFLGAIDSKDNDNQQKIIIELESKIKTLLEENENIMSEMKKIKSQKMSDMQAINDLTLENSSQREKLNELEKHLADNKATQLKEDLTNTRRRLADALCELDDSQTQLKQKTEEYTKALKAIQKMAEKIEDLCVQIEHLESVKGPASNDQEYNHTKSLIDELRQQIQTITKEKNEEIEKLRIELRKRTQNLQELVNKELWEKNREIERLTQIINSFQSKQRQQRSLDPFFLNDVHNMSASGSFSESKFNDAIERNRNAQQKINKLVQKLCTSHDQVTKHDVEQLNAQLKKLHEEHEQCELVKKGCADLCAVLSDRLEELSNFLNYLLSQSDVIALLGTEKGQEIQKVVNRTLDLSRSLNISRLSLPADQSLVHLENLSAFGLLDGTLGSFRQSADNNLNLINNLRAEIQSLKSQLEIKSQQTSLNTSSLKTLPKSPKLSPSNSKVQIPSDSEEWSEPDRNVSKARIGLETSVLNGTDKSLESTSEEDQQELQKRLELEERLKEKDELLAEKNDILLEIQEKYLLEESELKETIMKLEDKLEETLQQSELHQELTKKLEEEIDFYKEKLDELEEVLRNKNGEMSILKNEKDKLNNELKEIQENWDYLKQQNHTFADELEMKDRLNKELKEELELLQQNISINYVPKEKFDGLNSMIQRQQERMNIDQEQIIYMQTEITKMQTNLRENSVNIKTLQASLDASLERITKITEERNRLMDEKNKLKDQFLTMEEELDHVKFEKTELALKLMVKDDEKTDVKFTETQSDNASGYGSEELLNPKEEKENVHVVLEKPLLRTLEISEDRKSKLLSKSLEADLNCESCVQLDGEVKKLRKDVTRLKDALKKACYTLSQHNQRKVEIEQNIKKEILKTKDVLENARANMEMKIKQKQERALMEKQSK